MPVVATGALQLPDWRFVGAAGKIEFELLHPNLTSAQPDFPLHIHESSYVALGGV
jgi:hypothetical protein